MTPFDLLVAILFIYPEKSLLYSLYVKINLYLYVDKFTLIIINIILKSV